MEDKQDTDYVTRNLGTGVCGVNEHRVNSYMPYLTL